MMMKIVVNDYDLMYFNGYFVTAFATRLFSVLRYESVIHEFDPYFNYRTTKYLVEEGFYAFHNWFDDMAWYPLGRIIGGTIYPGLFDIVKCTVRKHTSTTMCMHVLESSAIVACVCSFILSFRFIIIYLIRLLQTYVYKTQYFSIS